MRHHDNCCPNKHRVSQQQSAWKSNRWKQNDNTWDWNFVPDPNQGQQDSAAADAQPLMLTDAPQAATPDGGQSQGAQKRKRGQPMPTRWITKDGRKVPNPDYVESDSDLDSSEDEGAKGDVDDMDTKSDGTEDRQHDQHGHAEAETTTMM